MDPDTLWASGSGPKDLIWASAGLWEASERCRASEVVAAGSWRQAGGRALSPRSSESGVQWPLGVGREQGDKSEVGCQDMEKKQQIRTLRTALVLQHATPWPFSCHRGSHSSMYSLRPVALCFFIALWCFPS